MDDIRVGVFVSAESIHEEGYEVRGVISEIYNNRIMVASESLCSFACWRRGATLISDKEFSSALREYARQLTLESQEHAT